MNNTIWLEEMEFRIEWIIVGIEEEVSGMDDRYPSKDIQWAFFKPKKGTHRYTRKMSNTWANIKPSHIFQLNGAYEGFTTGG